MKIAFYENDHRCLKIANFSYIFGASQRQSSIEAIFAIDYIKNLEVSRVEFALEVVLVDHIIVFVVEQLLFGTG